MLCGSLVPCSLCRNILQNKLETLGKVLGHTPGTPLSTPLGHLTTHLCNCPLFCELLFDTSLKPWVYQDIAPESRGGHCPRAS